MPCPSVPFFNRTSTFNLSSQHGILPLAKVGLLGYISPIFISPPRPVANDGLIGYRNGVMASVPSLIP
jgi:hypothetical protein